jgi:putative glutamine amidotransferase
MTDFMRRALFCGSFLAFATVWLGCGPRPAESGSSAESGEGLQGDSITIVLSKFYNSQNYRRWLGRLAEEGVSENRGGVRLPLRFVQAYGMEEEALSDELDRAKALVLTGGEDIHPARYGRAADTVRCGRIDPERDRIEHALLDHVMAEGTPCLGVCRGLQVMNVHGGGTLRPHLPDDGFEGHRGGSVGSTKDTLHPVVIRSDWRHGGQLFEVGEMTSVVSHHHQGIDRLAEGYAAWAEAPDGLIEGIRWADTAAVPFLVGVQWHPERSDSGQVLTDGLGRALLSGSYR